MEFLCKLCNERCHSEDEFFRHFNLRHRVSHRSSFLCGLPDCIAQFSKVEYYKYHVQVFHSRVSDSHKGPSEHRPPLESEGNKYKCAFHSCNYTARSKSTLRSHHFYHHKNAQLSVADNRPLANNEAGNRTEINVLHDECRTNLDSTNETATESNEDRQGASAVALSEHDTEEDLLKKLSHLYLVLLSKHNIPDSTLSFLHDGYSLILKESLNVTKERIKNVLSNNTAVQDSELKSIDEIVSNDLSLQFHSEKGPLRTPHTRRKQYLKYFKVVSPISRNLGLNDCNVQRKYHYIPLAETLKFLLEDESCYQQYCERKKQRFDLPEELLTDITSGSIFRNNRAFSEDSSRLQIILYQDDVEVVNPLGSGRCKYKLTAYYYTLGNLHPWSRSAIEPMQLLLLCREVDASYFGLPRILKPFLKDIAELEENGLEFRGKRIKVGLLNLLGDNLGTHIVSGLCENFSKSEYFCRYCEESRTDWIARWYGGNSNSNNDSGGDSDEENEDVDEADDDDDDDGGVADTDEESDTEESARTSRSETEATSPDTVQQGRHESSTIGDVSVTRRTAPLRTRESYNNCVKELENNRETVSNIKGVYSGSVLNKLKTFHVVGQTPPCIAHDMWEGVVSADLMLILKRLSNTYKFSFEYLNTKVTAFKFLGDDGLDKPANQAAKRKYLKGHAVQNYVFLRFLPLLIGDKITDKSDPMWNMVLLLIEINQYLSAPAISRNSIPYLDVLIRNYLLLRSTLFAERMKPKHHFMEHYPDLILMYGPLMRVSTIRFESKHVIIKSAVRNLKNFRNITKSVAFKHQLRQGSLSVKNLFQNEAVILDSELFCVLQPDLSVTVREKVISKFGAEFLPKLMCGNEISFRNIRFSKGKLVVIDCTNPNKIYFLKIELCLLLRQTAYVAGKKCCGVLDPSMRLYTVTEFNSADIFELSKLKDNSSYDIYNWKGKHAVVLKHLIVT